MVRRDALLAGLSLVLAKWKSNQSTLLAVYMGDTAAQNVTKMDATWREYESHPTNKPVVCSLVEQAS